jgi:hypothetical protein
LGTQDAVCVAEALGILGLGRIHICMAGRGAMSDKETQKMFMKKPIVVRARLVTESEVVLTAHGRVRAEPGDYILTDDQTGDTWPIKPDFFAANYEEVKL